MPQVWEGNLMYRFVRDEDNGMTSFARVTNAPARATTYRVVWTWGVPETILTGLDRETADAAAEGLNATAARYGHGKEYSVEEE